MFTSAFALDVIVVLGKLDQSHDTHTVPKEGAIAQVASIRRAPYVVRSAVLYTRPWSQMQIRAYDWNLLRWDLSFGAYIARFCHSIQTRRKARRKVYPTPIYSCPDNG